MHKIENAQDKDLNSINELRKAVSASFTDWDLDLNDIKKSSLRVTFVTKSNGQIVGYLSLHCRNSFQKDNETEFEYCVYPDYEGEGRGTSLVKEAIQFLKNKTKAEQFLAKISKNSQRSEEILKHKFEFSEIKKDNLGCILVKHINRKQKFTPYCISPLQVLS